MALEIYSDDARTVPVKQENVFTAHTTTHTLIGLIASDVQKVYKWTGAGYIIITSPTNYSITGSTLTLVAALTGTEHIVVMPTDNVSLVFTGAEGTSRSQTKKLVFHKGDSTTIYDALNLYSEDLAQTDTTLVFDASEVDYGGLTINTVDASWAVYNSIGLVTGLGVNISTDLTSFMIEGGAVIVNGQYVGDILAYDGVMIVLPEGTVLPVNGSEDHLQFVSTGSLRFALGIAGDTIPADSAFKRMVTIPTLTLADPTQYVWMRETVIIPSTTAESPSMPFKLIGQTYTG